MFDVQFKAKFSAPKPVAVTANHEEVNEVVLKFRAEFSHEIAEGIGDHGLSVRSLLTDLDARSARIPLDAITADVVVFDSAGQPAHTFASCAGVQAVAKVAKPTAKVEDPEPVITFELQAARTEANWQWLGQLFAKEATVKLTRRAEQKALPDIPAPKAKKGGA